MKRKTLLQPLVLCVAGLLTAATLSAQTYPSQPIKLVVPFAPGGSTDLTARMIAPRMQELLGQPVVGENRAGAGGAIATEFVARASADGYTEIGRAHV